MIGQYLLNKNENATVAKSEIFSDLNKALVGVISGQLAREARSAVHTDTVPESPWLGGERIPRDPSRRVGRVADRRLRVYGDRGRLPAGWRLAAAGLACSGYGDGRVHETRASNRIRPPPPVPRGGGWPSTASYRANRTESSARPGAGSAPTPTPTAQHREACHARVAPARQAGGGWTRPLTPHLVAMGAVVRQGSLPCRRVP